MPIEFLCPSCQQQLRVPDAAAGKNARCPNCSSIVKVPEGSPGPVDANSPFSPPAQPGIDFGPPEPKPSAPGGGGSFGAPAASNPFGDSTSKGYGSPYGGAGGGMGAGGPINPYASPAGTFGDGGFTGGVGHQVVDFGNVFNYAFKIWQDNLGLLVGTTFVVFILTFIANIVGDVFSRVVAGAGEPVAAVGVAFIMELAKFAFQTYLGIGQVQIALKLARQQRAEFGDLFGGGSRLLPVFGLVLLIALVAYLPLLVVGGIAFAVAAGGGGGGGNDAAVLMILPVVLLWFVAIVVAMLYFWPAYYLVVDGRAGVFESFGRATQISQGNKLNVFVLWMISVLIMVLGLIAVCIGLLFAAPLVGLLFAVAYLMMSGQVPAQATYQR